MSSGNESELKMKQLIILRHGKAEQGSLTMDDYERALTKRGINNAGGMGTFILHKVGTPDLVLSSSATRAYQTARLAAQNMNYPEEEIQVEQDLYFATAGWILNVISKLPKEINSCLFVGHNPGITDLINDLGVTLDNLPTASAICFEFQVDKWGDITPKRANFKWIKLAREL